MSDCLLVTLRFYLPSNWWHRVVSALGRKMGFVHVDVCWRTSILSVSITDSTPTTGVRCLSNVLLPIWKPNVVFCMIEIEGLTAEQLTEWVDSKVGEPYGWLDCIQGGIRAWTGITIGGNPRGVQCAEYAEALLRENGYNIHHIRGRTPDELAKELGVI